MDTDESGTLDKDEFLKIPQINSNPLAARLLAVFDTDGSGDIDFKEFLTGINVFSGKGTPEDKLKCNMYFKIVIFKVYDMDRDGYISNGELFLVLKMMVGTNLKDHQLQQIVDKTILESDSSKSGKLSFDDFKSIVERTDLAKQMSVEDQI